MSTVGGPDIITDGLVLSLDAANPLSYSGSGTTWNDLSGNGNTGTLVNSPGFNTANSGNIVFDGVNDYVDCGNNNSLKITGPLTMNAFFSASSFNIDYQPIIAMGDDSYRFQRHSSTNYLAFGSRNLGMNDLVSNSQISTNRWYNATAIYSGTEMLIYINGILDSSNSASGSLPVSNYNLRVGGNAQIPSRVWNGNIAIAQIYNRALSSSEVLQNYNAVKKRFGLS
jgi:hypothetical protein